jgi:hypothetical protein
MEETGICQSFCVIGASGGWLEARVVVREDGMARRRSAYTPLQEFFLLRVARLSRLHRRYQRRSDVEPARLLVYAALRSTLVDCVEVGVGPEAHALLDEPEQR